MPKKGYCKDCNKKLSSKEHLRCLDCYNKFRMGKKRGRYTLIPRCIDCDKEISDNRHERCKKCFGKWESGKNHPKGMKGKHHTEESRKKMRDNKIITDKTRKKMSIASKKRWANKEYREKNIRNLFKALQLKPNKPEKLLTKLLQKILPKEYKYVGNGKFLINTFNPDFINCNGQKKIIELYGDYWHNKKDMKKRDKKRLRTYKKYGYKTLIIWEKELQSINRLNSKILNFNKEK